MPAADDADHCLLFAVLALQMRFITPGALIVALRAWEADQGARLPELLIARGALDPRDRAPIELAMRRHLEKRHDDAARCLTELSLDLAEDVRSQIAQFDGGFRGDFTPPGSIQGGSPNPRADATTAWAPSPDATEDIGFQLHEKAGAPTPPSRFRPLRRHARGGLGEVHVAWDEELGRHVALKQMRPEYAESPSLRARFEREAEINGNLEHPGIVPVHGMGRYADGRPFYAMRFVRGETLQKTLDRFHKEAAGFSPARWAVEIRKLLGPFVVVCEAIAYAHARGVLHRDLKPSNIMIGRFGETLIIDWGLAKVTGRPEIMAAADQGPGPVPIPPSGDGPVPTTAGETLGSPPYMSPEQARGEHDTLNSATDIYSLGATLFCLLAGRAPILGSKPREIIPRVIRGEIDRLDEVESRVPPALRAICAKAMALDPAARYATALDLAADIGHWLADQPVSVYADPISTRLLRWARRRRTFVSAGLALLVASIVGLTIINVVVRDQKQRAELAQLEAQAAEREAQAAERRARDHLALGLTALDELVTVGDRQLISQATAGKRGQFLGLALEFVRQFAEREPDNVEVRRRASLVVRRLANLSMLIGQVDEADRLHDESVASMEALNTQHPGEAGLRDLLAEALLDRATSRLESGRVREALADLDRAEIMARTNLGAAPDHAPFLRTLGRVLDGKAQALDALGLAGAIDVSRQAIALLTPPADETLPGVRQALERGDNVPFFAQLLLTEALIHLAEFLHREDDSARAAEAAVQARRRMEELARLLGDPPIDGVAYALAYARLKENHLGGSADLNSVVAALGQLAEKHPEMVLYRLVLAEALHARAALELDSGDAGAAALDAERAFLIAEEILVSSPRLLAAWTLRAEILKALASATMPRPEVAAALRADSARSLAIAATLSPDNPRLKAQAAAARP